MWGTGYGGQGAGNSWLPFLYNHGLGMFRGRETAHPSRDLQVEAGEKSGTSSWPTTGDSTARPEWRTQCAGVEMEILNVKQQNSRCSQYFHHKDGNFNANSQDFTNGSKDGQAEATGAADVVLQVLPGPQWNLRSAVNAVESCALIVAVELLGHVKEGKRLIDRHSATLLLNNHFDL